MGIFNELGRRVGKFEQQAKTAAADDPGWGCRSCGSTFDETSEVCPDCGSQQVVALGADDSSDESGPVDEDASDDRTV
jgi:rRNA maturation endonuclease Nob1